MARAGGRLGTWQVLLTISAVIVPLCVHGRHSLARRHHHHNHSSVNKEALDTRMVLSDDSAEREHLIGAGIGAKPPHTRHHHSHKHHYLDVVEEDQPVAEELTAGGAGPDQPGNPLSDDIIKVEFHSPAPDVVPSDIALDWAKAPKPQKQRGRDPTSPWTLAEYDYLSPDNDVSAVDTTPEPEPTPSPPADMEDENPLLPGSPSKPESVKPNMDSGSYLPAPPMLGADREEEFGLSGAIGSDGCRLGFVLSGPGVCVSECDTEPNFCFNGGVCTVVAGTGAFCRCNVQDYIWNKGLRCEWAVTEFQVLCVVVAVASFVFLLLFMIVVFFAKSLYRLKSENIRLRKRSKYRPQSSEPQTDGLSVSTTADGSQPNDDPKKKDNQAKSPQPKEEGSMNILNSHSPKQENNRPASAVHGHTPNNTGENAEDGVTIGLEVLLPKEAKLHSDTSPPLQYDVFLYKVANNGDSASHSQAPPPHSSTSHVLPKSPKSPKQTKEHSCINQEPVSGRLSSPGRRSSPSRHSPPGSYSPIHSSSQHKCTSTCSSASPQLHRGQAPGPEHSGSERDNRSGRIRPSPSSPHLTQPPPSPSGMKNNAVSTRSLPP
ncbi:chondroitin sulfate proteoglycan 5b isoform X2 [Kryptolebias marmoratus]|uniref:chondroitin sulfate proteoglycan 5b isoform X2 n=1 Tax=Kryptolebias marmoratus TaxID=37003 RepID=UPI0007F93C3E|nr:chondroitin sulfate proteoglycan 5b isoform X2 [Kryptolebias marmoratus]